jgi:hypothetical protein
MVVMSRAERHLPSEDAKASSSAACEVSNAFDSLRSAASRDICHSTLPANCLPVDHA